MAELLLDEASHTYTLDGQELPGVTGVLEAAAMYPWPKREGDEPTFYMERGRLVHKACELDDDGILDEETVDPAIGPRLKSWRAFKAKSGVEILATEISLWHRRYRYAGTIDRIVRMGDRYGVLDLKCGAPVPAYAVQTSAYLDLVLQPEVLEELRIPQGRAWGRYVLHLDGTDYPRIHMFENHAQDATAFRHALGVYNWKRRTA